MMQRVLMQPGEVLALPIPAIAGLTAAEVQASALPAVVTRGYVVGSAALTVTASGGQIKLAGGTTGELYLVTIHATGAGGVAGQAEIEVQCIDLTWSMPDGGAPWLSIAQFVSKFGHEETVRMTDAQGDGRIDRDLLVNALTDAQALAEAHVSGRVAIDAQSVPPIIQVIVADVARARLYPGGAPDGIDTQAKVAMRNLEKIQSGQMTLGIAVPAAPETDAPIVFSKKPSQYADRLKGY